MTEWYERSIAENRRRLLEKVISDGEFTVLGVDMFDGDNYLIGRYTIQEEAFSVAHHRRREALTRASGPEIADRYYVYSPRGDYLGEGNETLCDNEGRGKRK